MKIYSHTSKETRLRWIGMAIALIGIGLILWMFLLPTDKEEGAWHDVTGQIESILKQDEEIQMDKLTSSATDQADPTDRTLSKLDAVTTMEPEILAQEGNTSQSTADKAEGDITEPSLDSVASLSSKVNINEASVDELVNIPGIGPAKAKAIVEYRSNYGNFQKSEDLLEVKGIGQKILEKMLTHLYIPSSVTK